MPSGSRNPRNPIWVCLLVAQVIFLGLLALKQLGALQSLDLMVYDLTLRMRPTLPVTDRQIILIDQTEEDIHKWGFPVSDGTLAEILDKLENSGARVIGVDKYRDIPVPPGKDRLKKLLRENQNIVWIYKFGKDNQQRVAPPAILANTDQIGFNDLIDDPGGIIRRGLLFLDDNQNTAYSFPLVMVLHYLAQDGIGMEADTINPEYVRLGKTTIRPFESNDGGYRAADASGYQFLLDYRTMPSHFPTFTFSELLEDKVPAAAVKDKMVIIGSSAKSLQDNVYTPFSNGFGVTDQYLFGYEMHAQVIEQLLGMALTGKRNVNTLNESYEGMLLWLSCTLGALVGFKLRSLRNFSMVIALGSSTMFAVSYFGIMNEWWIPVIPPVFGWIAVVSSTAAYVSGLEKNQKKLLMQIFATHVSSDVAEAMWRERDQYLDGSRPRPKQVTATVMFTDIRGFTTISEKLDPQSLFDWLNEYMGVMSKVVIAHNGMINKYIGDAIMAVFGVPIPSSSHEEISRDAVHAVDCALAMRCALDQLNEKLVANGSAAIGMRIGIFTGQLAAGTLGGSERVEYTVIGDTVNIASRLESYKGTKKDDVPCRILIGETTLGYLNNRYQTHLVGSIALKGKDVPITIYHVDGQS